MVLEFRSAVTTAHQTIVTFQIKYQCLMLLPGWDRRI